MTIYILNEENITNKQFVLSSISYPSNWCIFATEEELLEKGILTLEEIWPGLEAGQKYDGTYVDDLEAKTRTYNVTNISI